MPQIDFFILSRLSSVLVAVVLVLAFLLVHYVMLKRWIKSAIKISFLVTLMADLRFIKSYVTQLAVSTFLYDFLEQFIFVFNPFFALVILFLIYFLIVAVTVSSWLSDVFFNVFKSVMSGYSTIEFLYLRKFSLFFFSSFVIIFIFNIFGMLPLSFTFTSSLAVPFFFALTSFLIWFALIFFNKPFKSLNFFLHQGTNFLIAPLIILIEIISHFSKFISLAVRLFANMFAGHLLLKAFYSFVFIIFLNLSFLNFFYSTFVIGFTLFIISLEFLIAFLQAYVALLLMVLYISGVRHFSANH